ncbi:MAG: queuosine precursor transporter [Parvularcula sp.]
MLESSIKSLIDWLATVPPLGIAVLTILSVYGSLLLFLRLFGRTGAAAFCAIAVIIANIQVLKVVKFGFAPDPLALGTILFTSTYLVTDILNELYGKRAARSVIWVGFAALIFFNVIMILTLGYGPLNDTALSGDYSWASDVDRALETLFLPQPGLLAAGLISFAVSQLIDIQIFSWIRRETKGKFLWLRNTVSTAISTLIDSTIFSVLAWVVFAADPIPWRVVIITYILGSYGVRLALAFIDTPFMYLARSALRKRRR